MLEQDPVSEEGLRSAYEHEEGPQRADLPGNVDAEDPGTEMQAGVAEIGVAVVPGVPAGVAEDALAAVDAVPAEQPPEPAAAREARAQRPLRRGSLRVMAEESVTLPQGKLTFCGQGSFAATCANPSHNRCVLTRTALEGRSRAQGRPLAFLASWLELGATVSSKAEHWNKDNWPSLAQRQTKREQIMADPSFDALLALQTCTLMTKSKPPPLDIMWDQERSPH